MTLNIEDAPSNEEILASKRDASERVRLWRKRSIKSLIALFLSCAAVVPFSQGHYLYAYWDSFGKYLGILVMGVFFIAVYCTALWWSAWSLLRDLEKTYPSSTE